MPVRKVGSRFAAVEVVETVEAVAAGGAVVRSAAVRSAPVVYMQNDNPEHDSSDNNQSVLMSL
ncbi:hypothetical protein [Alteribacter natronophilus]|uniref:hypothetical protein n=1 Tax=Alteribacter natronophilus TaxID=2583810 RepID=UPI003F670CCD